MKTLLKYTIPTLFIGFVLAIAAHAQVVNPPLFRKVGNNIYPLGNPASTTMGTSTAVGQFQKLTDGSGNLYSTSTGSGASTSTSNTWSGTQAFETTTVGTVNGIAYLPSPTQLAGGALCGTTAGVIEVGNCINDIYSASASGTTINVGPYNYSSALWTNPINVTTDHKFLNISCVANASIFNWGGTGTSTFWNYGSAASAAGYPAHTSGVSLQNCSFYGPDINGTTTFATVGGTQGAEGFAAQGNRFIGWGQVIVFSSNVWVPNITYNLFIGNGQAIQWPNGLSNAGERPNIDHNVIADCVPSGYTSSTLENCVSLKNTVGLNFTHNSLDDGGVTLAGGNQGANISNDYAENPFVAHNSNALAYHAITISGANQNVNITDFTVMQDATSTETTSTPDAFIACGIGSVCNLNGVTAIANPNNNATTTKWLVSMTASSAQLMAVGIVNTSGTAFKQIDLNAPTGTTNLLQPYEDIGNTSPSFSFASGTILGYVNRFTGIQSGILTVATGGGNARTFSFAVPYNVVPICTMTGASSTGAALLIRSQVITTSTDTFWDSTALATNTAATFICIGNPN